MNHAVYEAFFDELSEIEKQAGLGSDIYRTSLRAAAKTRRVARKAGRAYDDLGRKTFSKLPQPVQDNFHKIHTLMEPSDMPTPGVGELAGHVLKRTLVR
jgi:hypothetical protein